MRWPWCLAMLLLAACAGPRERVVLLGAEPGEELVVSTAQGTTTLTTPETTAAVSPAGRIALGILTPEQVQTRYGAVLAAVPDAASLYTFHFATGQTRLDARGRATLADLLAEVQRRGVVEVEVTGHTDQTGSDAANDRLSMTRAEAVRLLLWQGGLTTPFVRVVGRGSRSPLRNRPGVPTPENRRVEVLVR